MKSFLVASYVVLWILVLMLLFLVLLLYRQYGRSLMGPRQRINSAGLAVNEKAPMLSLKAADDSPMTVDWHGSSRATVALFAVPGCTICEHLWEEERMAVLTREWPDIEFIWVDADRGHLHAGPVPTGWRFSYSADRSAHEAVEFPASPYVYVIGSDARVLAKGLINHGSDVGEMVSGAFNVHLALDQA
jgi:hypothetical protein